jgi:hypothetical protein
VDICARTVLAKQNRIIPHRAKAKKWRKDEKKRGKKRRSESRKSVCILDSFIFHLYQNPLKLKKDEISFT